MRALFTAQGLWDIVLNGPTIPTRTISTPSKIIKLTKDIKISEDERQMNVRAICMIYQGVFEIIFLRIMGAETTKAVWDLLQEVKKHIKEMTSVQPVFSE